MHGVEILGMSLENPILVASGDLSGEEKHIRALLKLGAGAVITKTIYAGKFNVERGMTRRYATGLMNSTTYSLQPLHTWLSSIRRMSDDKLPVIVSIHADSPASISGLANELVNAGCQALELGISCPHSDSGVSDPEDIYSLTMAVRNIVDVSISVKLAAVSRLRERVDAALSAGADAISLSDTLPGTMVDSETGRLPFSESVGYSGPGIKPIVLDYIHGLRTQDIKCPILGVGGIGTADDVIEYLSLGCSATQVYTSLIIKGRKYLRELVTDFINRINQLDRPVSEIIGQTFG